MGRSPWDSYRALMEIRQRMNELFRQSVSQFERLPDVQPSWQTWKPAFDIVDSEEQLLIYGEIPGMKKEDLEISITGNELAIRGERKPSLAGQAATYHHAERLYGRFERIFQLPEAVEEEQVKTSFKKGVLEISLPKRKPRTIPIQ